MIPIRDSAAARRLTPMNSLLIAANVAVFAYEVALRERLDSFMAEYSMVPALVSDSLHAAERGHVGWPLVTLVSSMFLHAGILHIAGNMLYLYIFGAAVEGRLGARRYCEFYFICGMIAGLAMVAIAPQSRVPVVGASGAIAGALGAYFIMYPRGRILTLVPFFIFIQMIEIPAVLYLLVWFAVQLYAGLSEGSHGAVNGGVAWWAHVGGFLFGIAFGPLMARPARRRRRV